MDNFFSMDGYGVWIWSAWGISGLALLGLLVWSLMERRAARARLAQLEDDAS
ncbi:MAG: heme exporter protein CcmD [Maricaulis sp.]|jgi:heme exporter protein CcmD|nr:heme exporter protein CcmD [Maricaulis sp.]MDG2043533.1 heme exporter protein CcmD [Maricaulis sp.]